MGSEGRVSQSLRQSFVQGVIFNSLAAYIFSPSSPPAFFEPISFSIVPYLKILDSLLQEYSTTSRSHANSLNSLPPPKTIIMYNESFNPYAPVFILKELLTHKANGTFPSKYDTSPSTISTTWSLNRAIRQYASMIKQRNLIAYSSSDAFNEALAQLEILVEKWGHWGNIGKEDVPLLKQRLEEYEIAVKPLRGVGWL